MPHDGVRAGVDHFLTLLDFRHRSREAVLSKRLPGTDGVDHNGEAAEHLNPGRHCRKAVAGGVPTHEHHPGAEAEHEQRQPHAVPGLLVTLQRGRHTLAQQAWAVLRQPEDHRKAADRDEPDEGPGGRIGQRAGRPQN